MNPRVGSWLLGILVHLLALPALAQDVTLGSIAGKVAYSTGRGIPEAVLVVTSEFGTRTTKTDERGEFILPKPTDAMPRARAAVLKALELDDSLVAGKATYQFMADMFNIFNEQQPTRFDDNVEMQAGVPDPDFLKPVEYQDPRTVRLAVRANF